jgi:hypothetical protein
MRTYDPNVNPEHKYNKFQYMDVVVGAAKRTGQVRRAKAHQLHGHSLQHIPFRGQQCLKLHRMQFESRVYEPIVNKKFFFSDVQLA